MDEMGFQDEFSMAQVEAAIVSFKLISIVCVCAIFFSLVLCEYVMKKSSLVMVLEFGGDRIVFYCGAITSFDM